MEVESTEGTEKILVIYKKMPFQNSQQIEDIYVIFVWKIQNILDAAALWNNESGKIWEILLAEYCNSIINSQVPALQFSRDFVTNEVLGLMMFPFCARVSCEKSKIEWKCGK